MTENFENWIKENSITEVECLVPDLGGIARGKILPTNKFIKGIRIIYILNYLPFSKEEAIETLKKKVGWKVIGGKHHESYYTRFVQSYLQPVKFNLDYRRATLSSQICSGEVTRQYALEQLKKTSYEIEDIDFEKEYVSKKLGITTEEFEKIINAPPKSYKDYPNDEKKLSFIYNIYRKYVSNALRY